MWLSTVIRLTLLLAQFNVPSANGSLASNTTTIINASSCTEAALNTAFSSVTVDNTIILVPVSTCTWIGGTNVNITLSHSVTLQGAGARHATNMGAGTIGTDQTTIIDNLSTSPALSVTTVAGKSFRITGIAFLENGSSPISSSGVLQVNGTGTSVRIDKCHFYSAIGGSSDFHINGSVQGVADHNFYDALTGILNNSIGFQNGQGWNGGSSSDFGDASWADVENYGTSKFFFIEDSLFNNGDTSDAVFGARFVFRYNNVIGDGNSQQQMYWHGATSGRERGGRAAEVYGNTFNQSGNYGNPPTSLNSGTILFYNNVVTGGYQYGVGVSYDFRTTAGGGGAYHYVPTPNGWGFCGTASGGPSNWDSNSISSGYPCLDQPGRGQGQLLNGLNFPSTLNSITGTIAWPNQALVPIRVWNNNYTPHFYTSSLIIGNNTGGSGPSIITNNVDYYMDFGPLANPGSFTGATGIGVGVNASKPGTCTTGVGYWATDQSKLYVCGPTNTWTVYYTPYIYPHPLNI